MNRATATDRAKEILREYARRTGLAPAGAAPARYLWTDAFAVCTYLGLSETTGEPACRARALALVEQVHAVLGRHRGDDGRTGWISGLPESEGPVHPTAGGLRIGKPLPERRPGEAVRRPARVGPRRPVLPLPDQVGPRALPRLARDPRPGLRVVGRRAREGRPPGLRPRTAADVLEDVRRPLAPARDLDGPARPARRVRHVRRGPGGLGRGPLAGDGRPRRAPPRRGPRDRRPARDGRAALRRGPDRGALGAGRVSGRRPPRARARRGPVRRRGLRAVGHDLGTRPSTGSRSASSASPSGSAAPAGSAPRSRPRRPPS